MIFIERTQTDPYFNIAAEEYFLKNRDEEIFMFWQSEPSVILGKHQNPVKEIDLDYVNDHHIPVIRRISGGGTVFHDLGNINYTLITRGEKQENLVDFKKFTFPVILFLKEFGMKARFEGKNNLTLGGKKFSGNSAHVFKKKVMHHGTLLFETNLGVLENVINPHQSGVKDKSIASVRASVTNISDHLKEKISPEGFKKRMSDFFVSYYGIKIFQNLAEEDIAEIRKLADEKYRSWSWNFGYSPKYSFSNEKETKSGMVQVNLEVKDGVINRIRFFLNGKRFPEMENEFLGMPHDKNILKKKVFAKQNAGTFIEVLFPGKVSDKVRRM